MSLKDHLAAIRGRPTAHAQIEADAEIDNTEEEHDDMPANDSQTAPAPEAKPATPEAADPAAVAEFCAANGCAGMAAGLIRDGATMDAVRAKVDAAGNIRQMAEAAARAAPAIKDNISALAEAAITAGLSADAARAKLFDAVVAAQAPAINSAVNPDATAQAAHTHGWEKAVAKVNGTKAAA